MEINTNPQLLQDGNKLLKQLRKAFVAHQLAAETSGNSSLTRLQALNEQAATILSSTHGSFFEVLTDIREELEALSNAADEAKIVGPETEGATEQN